MQDDSKDKTSEAYKDKLNVAMKAFNAGCIIYSQDRKCWYTPREFMECDERVVFGGMGLEKHINFTLMYPHHAIARKFEDLQRAQAACDAFVKKVLTAFEFKYKPLDEKEG